MSPLRSLYDRPFYKNRVCPLDITYNPCLGSCGGRGVILKDIISGTFNYAEQKDSLKIFIGCVWENDGRGRGLVALQSFSTIKTSSIPFSFQSNKPYSKLLRQHMVISKLLSDTWENTRFGGGGAIHLLNHIKGTRISNYQSNEPPSKFIRTPYMPSGHNLQPLPWGCGECYPQRHNFRTF